MADSLLRTCVQCGKKKPLYDFGTGRQVCFSCARANLKEGRRTCFACREIKPLSAFREAARGRKVTCAACQDEREKKLNRTCQRCGGPSGAAFTCAPCRAVAGVAKRRCSCGAALDVTEAKCEKCSAPPQVVYEVQVESFEDKPLGEWGPPQAEPPKDEEPPAWSPRVGRYRFQRKDAPKRLVFVRLVTEAGFTKAQFARLMGVDARTVYRLSAGEAEIYPERAARILSFFNSPAVLWALKRRPEDTFTAEELFAVDPLS